MVKLAIVTAESSLIYKNDKPLPCVVLIGRDENNKKRMWRTTYWPYFYLREKDFIKLSDSEYKIKDLRAAIGTPVRSLDKRPLTKIMLNSNKDINHTLRSIFKWGKVKFESKGMYSFEGDLSSARFLALRYLIDKGIKSGVEILEDNTIIPIDLDVKLRKWYIDFEAYAVKMCSQGPKRDTPITMVSIWDSYTETLYTLYARSAAWKGRRIIFRPMVKRHVIKGFKSELLLLEHLKSMVINLDPDMLIAWNLDRYDIIQWFYRMQANNIKLSSLSPISGVKRTFRSYTIKGRILFDLMRAYKRYTLGELRSYSLLFVVKNEELKAEVELKKIPFKGTPASTWDNYPQTVFKRNVFDVLIIKALDDKHELVDTYDDLRKEFGALFHETLIPYRLVDTALMRYVNGKVALRTTVRRDKGGGKFLGAIVVEPAPGKYKYIAQFDFSREYPSLIKAFNISPETYREPGFKGPCHIIKYKEYIFKFIKKPLGLLPQLIKSFFKKRDLYELEYAEAIQGGDPVHIKKWWRRIFYVKQLANTIYGVMDFYGFRLFRKECSAATAVLGRIGIEQLIVCAKRLGYEIIYGDTDSVFVQLKSKEPKAALEESKELAKQFNISLSAFFSKKYKIPKAPSELGLKKIYSCFLMFSKKFYAGKYIYDDKKGWKTDYDFKGLEIIRSDSSDLEKEILETMIKMLLSEEPISKLKAYWSTTTRNYNNRVYDYMTVSFPAQIRRKFEDYNHDPANKQYLPAHVRAVLITNKILNTDFGPGDKPRRLPVKLSCRKVEVEFKGKMLSIAFRDVSVAEDMLLPDWILQSIDWPRIYKRLQGKVNKIMNLVQINTTLDQFRGDHDK